jgi:diaminohydroxyphosphoribosylaminopyrimidine deaminase/5-amino-6-(5-phosphoribosylamino)uracil reductase
VVAGVVDPNPAVSGEGFRMLREAGLDVTAGFMAEESVALIEPFKTWVTLGRPFVTLKMAASLDGKVAAPDGTSRWITGEPARLQVHEIRSTVDAILVGSGTVLADDPQLTVRLPDFHANQPRRVVFDSSGRTPATARVFDGTAPAVVVTTSGAPGPARSAWEEAGAEVIEVPSGEGGVDVRAALRELAALGISHVLAEGGPALAAGLMAEGLVDHLILYLAPIVIGGDAPGLFAGGAKTLTEAWNLEIVEVSRIGDDLRIDARRSD